MDDLKLFRDVIRKFTDAQLAEVIKEVILNLELRNLKLNAETLREVYVRLNRSEL